MLSAAGPDERVNDDQALEDDRRIWIPQSPRQRPADVLQTAIVRERRADDAVDVLRQSALRRDERPRTLALGGACFGLVASATILFHCDMSAQSRSVRKVGNGERWRTVRGCAVVLNVNRRARDPAERGRAQATVRSRP